MKLHKKDFIKNLPTQPGVYQMLNKADKVLYVGKAKNLKRRLSSYFLTTKDSLKTNTLMQQVVDIKTIITNTENEALLLENTLIKKLKPKYNMDLKDDKSYIYINLSSHDFPRLSLRRETEKIMGKYYGPYVSSTAAREVSNMLHKVFKLRQCSDAFFRNRSRPCVQYQIERCSAPCVGCINATDYKLSVAMVDKFLRGKSTEIMRDIKAKMHQAATKLDYEAATRYRDQLESLTKIHEQQYVYGKTGNIDAIAAVSKNTQICMQILFIRSGKVVGSKSYFPKTHYQFNEAEAVSAFITQYYLNTIKQQTMPQRILLNVKLTDRAWIENVLNEQLSRKIKLLHNVRGNNRQWLKMAEKNAKQALTMYLGAKDSNINELKQLQQAFKLKRLPQKLECFDISHTMGEATVASCVIFDKTGALKQEYRRFNIKNITKGDDYAAMEQVLQRRYKNNKFPDIVIIDGGKGQLTRAKKIIQDKNVTILAIAKGPSRKPGAEIIYASNFNVPISLAADSPALHLLQRIRDEAHRFAITGHRTKRAKAKIASKLENISGIGSKKRQELLKYFDGIQGVVNASEEELTKVPGISRTLARRIRSKL